MAIEIVYTIEDRSGTKGTSSVRIADDPTIAGLKGFAESWATMINNLTLGKVLSAVAHLLANITGLTSNTIAPSSDVEHLGKFQFITASGIRMNVNIPALAEAAVGADTADELNQAQADVAAFLAAMEDGILVGAATIQPCDIGEEDIVGTVFSREGARNSGARR